MNGSGEDRLLGWLRRQLDRPLIGDDAAILPAGGSRAVTMDSQISGVHFPADLDPALLARRLLAVNLSDLAAMGAEPTHAFLALAAGAGFDHKRFFRALLASCRAAGVKLAGGDLARAPAGEGSASIIATLALMGGKPARGRWVRRTGARPGQRIWLGGTAGESAAGRLLIERGARLRPPATVVLPSSWAGSAALVAAARRAVRRHLLPKAQLELGAWLSLAPHGAAIDVSDGLARDLHRLCRESRVGARIVAEDLPLAGNVEGFSALAESLGADPWSLALGGGEDYVLLFTLPRGTAPPPRFGCRDIGSITGGRSLVLVRRGRPAPLPDVGWDHLAPQEESS